jgi:hypothetical protein
MKRNHNLYKSDCINTDPMSCCAVAEISGIRHFATEPANVIVDVLCTEGYDNDEPYLLLEPPESAHIIFTQASRGKVKTGYGYTLRDYIVSQKLGTVVCSTPSKNPNTQNNVTVFVWTLDMPGIRQWAKRNGIQT